MISDAELQRSSKSVMELRNQLELEQKKGLEQKNELQEQAVQLQSLRSKGDVLESEILQKTQNCERLDRELEQAKSKLGELEVTWVQVALPCFLQFLQSTFTT